MNSIFSRCNNGFLHKSEYPLILNFESEMQSREPRYRVGDLFWAKSPGHPWWPCMISSFPPPDNMSHIEEPNEHLGVMVGNNNNVVRCIVRQKPRVFLGCRYQLMF
jgi:hypothetical protein